MKIKRRSPFTLMEVMIVILIIGIVGSVLGYNMRGSLDEGRAYKSEHASKQVHDFLSLAIAQGRELATFKEHPEEELATVGFVNNPKKLLQDGWGSNFQLKETGENEFVVYSAKWEKYLLNKKKMTHEQIEEAYPWAFSHKNAET